MGSVIFKGDKVATLKDAIQIGKTDSDSPRILKLSTDPTSSATDATRGSLGMLYSTGAIYRKLDDGSSTNWEIFGEGGSGGINYIENPDFESGSDGWATYGDAAGPDPVDGTGGASPNTSFIAVTAAADVIRGTVSREIGNGGASAQGQGVSVDFQIDNADLGKRLYVSFDYYVDTPANYTNGDLAVYIYDITNANLIGRVTEDNDGDLMSVGSPGGRFTGSFETASDSNDYRLIFHKTTVNASLYNLVLDNVRVGPGDVVPGSIITDWQDYTVAITAPTTNPTKNGSPDHEEARWRRVGQNMEIQYSYRQSGAGTAGSGSYEFSLPSGYNIDTAFYNSAGSGAQGSLGVAAAYNGTDFYTGYARHQSATTVAINLVSNTGTGLVGSSFLALSGATVRYTFSISVRVVEFASSGASLSTTESLFNTARCRAVLSASQTISTAAETQIEFDTVDFDSTSSFDTTNFEYVVPATGDYFVNCQMRADNVSGGTQASLAVKKNGTTNILRLFQGDANNEYIYGTSGMVRLDKGDTVGVYGDAGADASWQVTDVDSETFLDIHRVSDFSTFSVFGKNEFLEATSSTHTPAGNGLQTVTGNDITLTPGTWLLMPSARFTNSGAPVYTNIAAVISTSNGTNTTPTLDAGTNEVNYRFTSGNSDLWDMPHKPTRITVTSNTTLYYVPSITAGTPGNSRIITYWYAERLV